MLWLPTAGGPRAITNLVAGATLTPGTPLPGSATTDVPGAVTEVITAVQNTQHSWGIAINIGATGFGAVDSRAVVDILVGGATDDLLIPRLICGHTSPGAGGMGFVYFFPLHIPRGVRIAAQLTDARPDTTARIAVTLFGGSPPPWRVGRKVVAYGTGLYGQALTVSSSGAAAGVTELAAATAEDLIAFMPGFQTGATVFTALMFNVGIGVGAAPEERIGTWWWGHEVTNRLIVGPHLPWPVFRDVPAGSRLTMMASSSGAVVLPYTGLIYGVVP